jgi:SAM-dependent methyltransferase
MSQPKMKLLNVGGNDRNIRLPEEFEEFEHLLLDIDPAVNPDVLCDAREMTSKLDGNQFDVVYCSHNLEHYYEHDVNKVLTSFWHVLKNGGMLVARVPDIGAVMRTVVAQDLDIDDVLYQADAGPIRVLDIMYGWSAQMERSGNEFFAHKTGFTVKSLVAKVQQAGFVDVYMAASDLEIRLWAFKNSARPDLLAKVPKN